MNFQLFIRGSAGIIFLVTLLLILAGRLNYWQAWGLGAISLLAVTGISILFRKDFDAIRARMKSGPGTKWWDILFWIIYGPMNLAIPLIAGLDAGRFHWSPSLPVYVYIAGYLFFITFASLHLWAIWANKFYAGTVRIQEEKRQFVISHGPYRYIRHPGYIGIMLMLSSLSIVLGSLWALLPVIIILFLLFIRTTLEDQTLKKELPGYLEYSQRVRYRLIPGIW